MFLLSHIITLFTANAPHLLAGLEVEFCLINSLLSMHPQTQSSPPFIVSQDECFA